MEESSKNNENNDELPIESLTSSILVDDTQEIIVGPYKSNVLEMTAANVPSVPLFDIERNGPTALQEQKIESSSNSTLNNSENKHCLTQAPTIESESVTCDAHSKLQRNTRLDLDIVDNSITGIIYTGSEATHDNLQVQTNFMTQGSFDPVEICQSDESDSEDIDLVVLPIKNSISTSYTRVKIEKKSDKLSLRDYNMQMLNVAKLQNRNRREVEVREFMARDEEKKLKREIRRGEIQKSVKDKKNEVCEIDVVPAFEDVEDEDFVNNTMEDVPARVNIVECSDDEDLVEDVLLTELFQPEGIRDDQDDGFDSDGYAYF